MFVQRELRVLRVRERTAAGGVVSAVLREQPAVRVVQQRSAEELGGAICQRNVPHQNPLRQPVALRAEATKFVSEQRKQVFAA